MKKIEKRKTSKLTTKAHNKKKMLQPKSLSNFMNKNTWTASPEAAKVEE